MVLRVFRVTILDFVGFLLLELELGFLVRETLEERSGVLLTGRRSIEVVRELLLVEREFRETAAGLVVRVAVLRTLPVVPLVCVFVPCRFMASVVLLDVLFAPATVAFRLDG